jgi:polyferredoxin
MLNIIYAYNIRSTCITCITCITPCDYQRVKVIQVHSGAIRVIHAPFRAIKDKYSDDKTERNK